MFHFSTDRLAGLDAMILKITPPQKVPMLIANHSIHDTTVRKLKKQKPPQETRPPLTDKTASNNLFLCPPNSTSSMILRTLPTPGGAVLFPPKDPSSPCPPDLSSFRPLPPLPSASALQLPSFLNLSTQSLDSLPDTWHQPTPFPPPPPPPALSCVPSSPVPSSYRIIPCRTKNGQVFEGPQWVPAFHHPNSPYVPWSSSVRRRILPSFSPLSPSPILLSSPCIRSGAVAPEPWASSTFSQVHDQSTRVRLSRSWKSFKNSVKNSVTAVLSHLGKSKKSLRPFCTGQDMLHAYDGTDTAFAQPHLSSDAVRETFANGHGTGPRDSLASFVSSDSRTLANWLAERRASASCISDSSPVEISVEEYELAGSWLELRHCDGGWLCGIQNCGMHTVCGSPCVSNEHLNGFRMAMPFDSTDLPSGMDPSPQVPTWSFPLGPFSALPRSFSLPRLPGQTFDIHVAQEARPCLTRYRELSMPGGWTFS